MWDNLTTEGSGDEIYYQTLGTAPNRRFVVQWRAEHYDTTPRRADLRLVLHENGSDVSVCYADPSFGTATYNNGRRATAGIQGGAAGDLELSCNATSLTAGLVLDYKHP